MSEDLKRTFLDDEAKSIVEQFDSLELLEDENARKFRAKLCEELSKLTYLRRVLSSLDKDMSINPMCEKAAKESTELLQDILKPKYTCPHENWAFEACESDCRKCEKLQAKYEFADISKISRTQIYAI